jgi:hypothetical protein
MWESAVPGEKCVRNQLQIDKYKILLSPLHIKLGLMKNFVKAMKNTVRVLSIWKKNFLNSMMVN